jgi:UDP-N-acetylglucosamine 2-epimerase (non-hydrolysing)
MDERLAQLRHRPRGGLVCVVGARPNFMKMAPILRALAARGNAVPITLVHTGQHYGADMQESFFEQLGLPVPDIDLEVGSGTHARQTAEIMTRFEPVLDAVAPRGVVVVGDVNSTIACALVAVKKGVGVAHVEAGLRSRDRSMPEEINRVLTDQLSDLHFTTERGAGDNLLAEGASAAGIHFTGNVMIDSLRHHAAQAVAPAVTLERYEKDSASLEGRKGFALVTMHRPSNVDDPAMLRRMIGVLESVSERVPVVFPVHPRTRKALDAVRQPVGRAYPIIALPPVGYLEMLGLMQGAAVVLTDSGGMQEETTALGIPCLTLRENTERPVTVEQGTNTITGADPERILAALDHTLASGGKAGRIPELWDGHAGERIAAVLEDWVLEDQQAEAREA